MHIAVDLDNALELDNRLNDGSRHETKQLAKCAGGLRRHSVQASILDEALVDDDVHVMSRLSRLTQLLDANVTEKEKVLDALNDLLQILGIEVLNSENLDQTLLVGCELSRRNDRRRFFYRHRLRVDVRLKYSEMVDVEQERLGAVLTSELAGGSDERTNRLRLHLDIGRAAATDNVVWLRDGLVEPRRSIFSHSSVRSSVKVELSSFSLNYC